VPLTFPSSREQLSHWPSISVAGQDAMDFASSSLAIARMHLKEMVFWDGDFRKTIQLCFFWKKGQDKLMQMNKS